MTTVKRITDLTDYTSVLPYASEMFGVYQPLLGWKSKRVEQRLRDGYQNDKRQLLETLKRRFAPLVDITYGENQQVRIDVDPGVLVGGKLRQFDSIVLLKISAELPPFERLEPAVWPAVITDDRLQTILKNDVVQFYTRAYGDLRKAGAETFDTLMRTRGTDPQAMLARNNAQMAAFEQQVQYESSVAGVLAHLVRTKAFAVLTDMFYATRNSIEEAQQLIAKAMAQDGAEALLSLETIDPQDREHIRSVALSPIAVVHLFRQYFFELDTFLGTPVSHVWLSPGSSVELIEVHTRKTIVEKTLERVWRR